MTSPIRVGCRTAVTRFGRYCSIACLHVCAAIAFIGTDGSQARGSRSGATTWLMRQSGSTFEFSKDIFLVCKEIAYETVGMLFMHCQGVVSARAKDTGSQVIGKGCNIRLICRCELDKTGEVRGQGV